MNKIVLHSAVHDTHIASALLYDCNF